MDVWQIAEEAVSIGDQAHSISAIFLYQQLVEEMLHLVDYWCYFEQAMGLYPTKFDYSISERLMFGQIIQQVRQRQDFPYKNDLLQHSQKLNSDCRIPVAHKLLHKGTLPQIDTLAIDCQRLFKLIMACFNEIRTHFYARYEILSEKTGIERKV